MSHVHLKATYLGVLVVAKRIPHSSILSDWTAKDLERLFDKFWDKAFISQELAECHDEEPFYPDGETFVRMRILLLDTDVEEIRIVLRDFDPVFSSEDSAVRPGEIANYGIPADLAPASEPPRKLRRVASQGLKLHDLCEALIAPMELELSTDIIAQIKQKITMPLQAATPYLPSPNDIANLEAHHLFHGLLPYQPHCERFVRIFSNALYDRYIPSHGNVDCYHEIWSSLFLHPMALSSSELGLGMAFERSSEGCYNTSSPKKSEFLTYMHDAPILRGSENSVSVTISGATLALHHKNEAWDPLLCGKLPCTFAYVTSGPVIRFFAIAPTGITKLVNNHDVRSFRERFTVFVVIVNILRILRSFDQAGCFPPEHYHAPQHDDSATVELQACSVVKTIPSPQE